MSIFDKYHNKMRQLHKAIRFHEFTCKLLQIRASELWTRVIAPGNLYRSPSLPRDIVIRATEKCFLHCKFCAQGGERGRVDQNNLSLDPVEKETFQKIIHETSKWRIKPFIKITGGEPLVLGNYFLDVIREMRDQSLIVKLNTNGMLLKSRKIAKRIVEADLNYLSISIDGGREVHNKLRGNSKLFDAVMEGIENVHEYRMTMANKNPLILLSMVVSSETYHQVEEVYRIASEKKVDWFNVQFLNYTTPRTCEQAHFYARDRFGIQETPWDSFCNPRFNNINPDLLFSQLNAILAKQGTVPVSVMGGLSSYKDILQYHFSLDPIRHNICYMPFTGMHIVPPGKAVFCIDYPFYEYGDVRRESLESIWYGQKAHHFRSHLRDYYRENKKNFPQCQRCNWRFN